MELARFMLLALESLEEIKATLSRDFALELLELIEAHPCSVLPEFMSAVVVSLLVSKKIERALKDGLVCFENLAGLLEEEYVSVWIMLRGVQQFL